MKPLLLLFAMVAPWTVSPVRAELIAGPITNAANGLIYYLLSPKPFIESEAEAISLGGHLVAIDDAQENAWIYTTFSTTVRKCSVSFCHRALQQATQTPSASLLGTRSISWSVEVRMEFFMAQA